MIHVQCLEQHDSCLHPPPVPALHILLIAGEGVVRAANTLVTGRAGETIPTHSVLVRQPTTGGPGTTLASPPTWALQVN